MRTALVIVMWTGALAGLTGCPSRAGAGSPPAPALAGTPPKGEPLTLNDTTPAAAGTCAECQQAAGPSHLCGKSEWCAACNADKAAGGAQHACHVSHFCTACGLEAAIAGHRCGETRFDKATLSAADLEEDE